MHILLFLTSHRTIIFTSMEKLGLCLKLASQFKDHWDLKVNLFKKIHTRTYGAPFPQKRTTFLFLLGKRHFSPPNPLDVSRCASWWGGCKVVPLALSSKMSWYNSIRNKIFLITQFSKESSVPILGFFCSLARHFILIQVNRVSEKLGLGVSPLQGLWNITLSLGRIGNLDLTN